MGKLMQVRGLLRLVLLVVAGAFLMTGCSAKQVAVNFKVHTEPEGAYIVYKKDNLSWIYLGRTPIDVQEIVSSDFYSEKHTLIIKAMRCGYLEQMKEWTGDKLEDEIDNNGMIFWTPRLIKDTP
jgi:hypothetical protein